MVTFKVRTKLADGTEAVQKIKGIRNLKKYFSQHKGLTHTVRSGRVRKSNKTNPWIEYVKTYRGNSAYKRPDGKLDLQKIRDEYYKKFGKSKQIKAPKKTIKKSTKTKKVKEEVYNESDDSSYTDDGIPEDVSTLEKDDYYSD